MQRLAPGTVADLVPAARTAGDDDRIRAGADGWQQAGFRHLHRQRVVLALIAETARHAAAGTLDEHRVRPGQQPHRLEQSADRAEGLLVTMGMDQQRAVHAPQAQRAASGTHLARDELLEQQGLRRDPLRGRAEPERQCLVAQRQQAGRLEAHDGDACARKRIEHLDQLTCPCTTLAYHPLAQPGAAAAVVSALPDRGMQRITRGVQHARRSERDLALEAAMEGIDEQDRCLPARRGSREQLGWVRKYRRVACTPEGVGTPARQRSPRRETHQPFRQPCGERYPVPQVGEPRHATEDMRILGQVRDQAVFHRIAVLRPVMGEELNLHPGHVDTGRTLAPAALAAYAQIHRGAHGLRGKAAGPKLAGQREPERIGAAPRDVLLRARDAVARTHRAGIELAAVAVAVAHLDGLGEALRVVTTGARCRRRRADRIVLHVPGRPVEQRLERLGAIGTGCRRWRVPEQRRIVHARGIDDPSGVEQADRIELLLDGAESLVDCGPELPGDPFAAAQSVAVLAAEGALVAAHQFGGLLGDRAHPYGSALGAVATHVQDRPHVQGPDRGVCIPGAVSAMPCEYFGERVGVGGEMLERHRAILDEAHRLAVALEAHHDVQARLAHFPQRLLGRGLRHLDDAAGQPQIAHQLHQILQPCELRLTIIA